ncbi:MAG TPA: CbtB domain-containing protein [Vineibacter sp.]|nr:CbtB domain-containing protein [Vineibacter sp.]
MNAPSARSSDLIRTSSIGRLAPLVGAMLLGAVIVFGVGFSTLSAAHNAAHDVRHANNFPCH